MLQFLQKQPLSHKGLDERFAKPIFNKTTIFPEAFNFKEIIAGWDTVFCHLLDCVSFVTLHLCILFGLTPFVSSEEVFVLNEMNTVYEHKTNVLVTLEELR